MKSIFVSSTFKDMQFERDMLQILLAPEVSAFAAQYNETVSFVDLRWGISTDNLDSDEGAKKILSVCLDEIERCRPYMVIFVGDRYGWIPNEQLIFRAANSKAFTPKSTHCSVTELEIEFGALQAKEYLNRCIFCLRRPLPYDEMSARQREIYQAESCVHEQRLEALKQRIREAPDACIIEYEATWNSEQERISGLESLSDRIRGELCAKLSEEWGNLRSLTWQEAEALSASRFIQQKCADFSAREEELRRCQTVLCEGSPILCITGNTGTGKSTVLCKLEEVVADTSNTYSVICGNSVRSSDTSDIVRLMLFALENALSIEDHFDQPEQVKTYAEYRTRFHQLITEYGKSGREQMVLFADALDQLHDGRETGLDWVPDTLPENVRLVISCLPDFPLPERVRQVATQLSLEPLTQTDRELIIRSLLKVEHKELDGHVIRAIMQNEHTQNPLYLSLLIRRLIMFDNEDFSQIADRGNDMHAITAYMLELLAGCSCDLTGMCALIIQEAGGRINPVLTQECMRLLAASRYGLRESDLSKIIRAENLDWNPLDFARLTKYLRPYFTERIDGRIDFTHRSLREGILQQPDINLSATQAKILTHLKALPLNDTVRHNEIIHYLYQQDDKAYLADLLWDAMLMGRNITVEAKELRLLCLTQSTDWLKSVILDRRTIDKGAYLFSFFGTTFCKVFNDTLSENQSLLDVLQTVYTASAETEGFQVGHARAILARQIAELHFQFDHRPEGLHYYQQAYHLLKAVDRSGMDIPSVVNFSAVCKALGQYYLDEGDFELSQRYLYECLLQDQPDPKAARLQTVEERLSLSDDYYLIARILYEQGKNNAALEKLALSETICDELQTRVPDLTQERQLSHQMLRSNIAKSKGEFETVLQIQELLLQKRQQFFDERRDISARVALNEQRMNLIQCYSYVKRVDQAISMMDETIRFARILVAEQQTFAARRHEIAVLLRATIFYDTLGDLQKMRMTSQDAMKKAKQLMEESESADTMVMYSEALDAQCSVKYMEQDFLSVVDYRKEAVSIIEKVYAKTRSMQYGQRMLFARSKLASSLVDGYQPQEGALLMVGCLQQARAFLSNSATLFTWTIYKSILVDFLQCFMHTIFVEYCYQGVLIELSALLCRHEPWLPGAAGLCCNALASLAQEKKDYPLQLKWLQAAIHEKERQIADSPHRFLEESVCQDYSLIANCLKRLNRVPEERAYREKHDAELQRLCALVDTADHRIDRIFSLACLADMLETEDAERALSLNQQAIDLFRSLTNYQLDNNAKNFVSMAYEGIGKYYYAKGDRHRASSYFDENLAIRLEIQNSSKSSEIDSDFLNNLASAYFLVGSVASKEDRRSYFEVGKSMLISICKKEPENTMYLSNLKWVLDVLAHI